MSSTSGGTSAVVAEGGGGSRCITRERMPARLPASNGLRPVRSAQATAPSEKMSERASTVPPAACSGDM
jgi:hypothetical protein